MPQSGFLRGFWSSPLLSVLLRQVHLSASRLHPGRLASSSSWPGADRLGQLLFRLARRAINRQRRLLFSLTAFSAPKAAATAKAERDKQSESSTTRLDHQRWTGHVLPDSYLQNHRFDVSTAHKLIRRTLSCGDCGRRLRVSQEVEGVHYCACEAGRGPRYGVVASDDVAWTPFLERPDILVWRQEHPEVPTNYETMDTISYNLPVL